MLRPHNVYMARGREVYDTATRSQLLDDVWPADERFVAARHAQGEAISRIAQSYGCTPPAIHYILKRSKQRIALNPERAVNEGRQPRSTAHGAHGGGPVQTPAPAASIADLVRPSEPQSDRPTAPAGPAQLEQTQPHVPAYPPANPPNAALGRRNSLSLDRDLHVRAEAAIEAFRASFDAALAEGSPVVRQQLRRVAADLMRVAARTTIVLDQLNARAERQRVGG